MSIIAKENISISKKDIKESRTKGSINLTKTLVFKHEANVGELSINTLSLAAPQEAVLNGFVQPSPSELAGLNLLVNKPNLKMHSSRGIWLQMYEDFVVTGANTIQLIGNIEALGGAEQDEVFTVYATPVQTNAIITTDHKKMFQEYLLPDGETVLNLGREFEVGRNAQISQIGAIRVWRNGQGPLLRNVSNAAADENADGNYHEIDVGNGTGIQIEFNTPADGQDDVIVVEFGIEHAGDLSLVGDIHALYGAILKMADDVKDLGPFPISKYITANPSEVERRAFGDQVLNHELRVTALEVPIKYQEKILSANATTNAIIPDLTFNNLVIGKQYRIYAQLLMNSVSLSVSVAHIIHDGVIIAATYNRASNSGGGEAARFGVEAFFTATATTVAVHKISGTSIGGDGTKENSWARLEEIPDGKYVQTVDFT